MSDDDTNKIEFRLSPSFLQELDELTKKYNEKHAPKEPLKRNAFAKMLFTQALERVSIDRELSEVTGQVRSLRSNVATALTAMLIEFAKKDTGFAHKWVGNHMKG